MWAKARKALFGLLLFVFWYSLGVIHGTRGADVNLWAAVVVISVFSLLIYNLGFYILQKIGVIKFPT